MENLSNGDSDVNPRNTALLLKPLDELLENQLLLLRAARNAKNALNELEKPNQIAREVLANSPLKSIFVRNNLDPETFISLVIRKHENMMASVREIKSKNTKGNNKKIGQVYDDTRAEFFRELGEHCSNPEEFSLLEIQVTRSVLSPTSSAIIFQSLFVLAFAQFEHFLSVLTRSTLEERDEILGELQEKFTWAQIRQPESHLAIKGQMIRKMTDDLSRQSMKHWIGWYAKKNKMKMSIDLIEECEQLYELRNLFVHEQSVKAMYMKVANYGLVERACDRLAGLAVNMTESSVAFAGEQSRVQDFFGYLTRLEVRLLDEGRLWVVEQMCSLALGQVNLNTDIEIHRVNNWISRKRKNPDEDLFEELHAWKAEVISPVYYLAKLILLGKQVEAKIMAQSLKSQGVLSQEEWDTWPLFEELRADNSGVEAT